MRKHITIIIALIAAAISVVTLSTLQERTSTAVAPSAQQNVQQSEPAPASQAPAASHSSNPTPAASSNAPAPNVTLLVGSSSYHTFIPTGSTVFDLMRTLASTTDFRFTYRTYQSLGAFIESIDGMANAHDWYWFLYINGKSSQTGATQTALNPGDTVEWRYEKNY